jgi:hypothetical protein
MSAFEARRRVERRAGFVLAAALLAAAGAGAAIRPLPADPRAALRVGDWSLSRPALALLERVARAGRPDADAAAVAAAALEDRVVGEHARTTVGDDALFDNRFVALTPEAAAEASLYASFDAAWHAELAQALGPDGGLRHVVRRHALAPARLRELLGAGPQVRLDDRLPPARAAALDGVVLLEWRIDAREAGRVTLGDVWRRLTLQERNVLYNGDAGYAMHRAEQLARQAEVRHWVSANEGLDEADLAHLQALMADHDRRIAYLRWSGAVDEDHYHSAALDRLRREVDDADIRRWYDEHPDEFKRIERVRARHIRCADEARCDAASAALRRGEPFGDVARRFSEAADAGAGGELGWLDAARARSDWLAQLAFAQPPGPPTAPLREPAVAGAREGWEIVEVLERVTGRHAPDSEAVRFAAGREIARRRAAQQYAELRGKLLAAADIELDPALPGLDAAALAREVAR